MSEQLTPKLDVADCSVTLEEAQGVIRRQATELERVREWKAEQQQFLIQLSTRLIASGAKGDDIIKEVEEIISANQSLKRQIKSLLSPYDTF